MKTTKLSLLIVLISISFIQSRGDKGGENKISEVFKAIKAEYERRATLKESDPAAQEAKVDVWKAMNDRIHEMTTEQMTKFHEDGNTRSGSLALEQVAAEMAKKWHNPKKGTGLRFLEVVADDTANSDDKEEKSVKKRIGGKREEREKMLEAAKQAEKEAKRAEKEAKKAEKEAKRAEKEAKKAEKKAKQEIEHQIEENQAEQIQRSTEMPLVKDPISPSSQTEPEPEPVKQEDQKEKLRREKKLEKRAKSNKEKAERDSKHEQNSHSEKGKNSHDNKDPKPEEKEVSPPSDGTNPTENKESQEETEVQPEVSSKKNFFQAFTSRFPNISEFNAKKDKNEENNAESVTPEVNQKKEKRNRGAKTKNNWGNQRKAKVFGY